MNQITTLLNHKSQGHIFHGSYNGNIKELEVKNTTDSDSDHKFNNDTAIFASYDLPSTIAFALFKNWQTRQDFPDELRIGGWGIDWTEEGPVATLTPLWKPILKTVSGFVYALPSESFTEKEGDQYKSKISVKPVEVIPLVIDGYYELGGKIDLLDEIINQ